MSNPVKRLAMDTIFLWPPVLWAARIVLLMALAVTGVCVAVFIVRVLHPRNIWALLTARAPSILPADGRFAVLEVGGGITIRCLPDSVLRDPHPANDRPAAPRRPQPN